MTQEMGKPITESRGEVKYAAAFVEWYAEEAKRAYGDIVPTHAANKRLFAMRQPVGPVYAVTPWNFPAAMVTRKVAPALAAGCTVVLKPAEQSPLTAIRLGELWVQAGGPADVFQVLTTSDPAAVSDVFFADARVRKLTFTGSTEVGIKLYEKAARTVKRVSLELGGHAPFIICEDADIPAAVQQVMASKFRNAGQTCVCANRIYVHDRIQRGVRRSHGRGRAQAARRRSDERSDAGRSAGRPAGPRQGGRARRRCGRQGRERRRRRPAEGTACSSSRRCWSASRAGCGSSRRKPSARWRRLSGSPTRPRSSAPPTPRRTAWPRMSGRATSAALSAIAEAARIRHRRRQRRPAGRAARAVWRREVSGIGREGGPWGLEEYLDVKYVSIVLP